MGELGIGPMRPQGGKPVTLRDKAHIEVRRARAEAMELAGATIKAIAETLQVDYHTAYDDILAIRKARRERAAGVDLETERQLELERLEQQRLDLNKKLQANPGDVQVHRILIRLAERKSNLLGLDTPARVKYAELAPGDSAVDGFEEIKKAPTLAELVGDKADGADLAKVLYLAMNESDAEAV